MNAPLLYADHLEKYRSNLEFAQWVRQHRPDSPDWCATAYFYAALHLLEAYLHSRNLVCDDYRAIGNALAELRARGVLPSDQWTNYDRVRSLSQRARYDQVQLMVIEMEETIAAHFEPLEKWLVAELGLEGPREPETKPLRP